MLYLVKRYFWPAFPASISEEGKAALEADLKAERTWSSQPGEQNRQRVDVWTRHSDNQSRAENRKWFKEHGMKFVRRWSALSCIAWAGAWAASGSLWTEVPLTLTGVVAGAVAIFFQFQRRI